MYYVFLSTIYFIFVMGNGSVTSNLYGKGSPLRIFQQQGLFCWHFSVFGGSVLYWGDFLWYNRKVYKYSINIM